MHRIKLLDPLLRKVVELSTDFISVIDTDGSIVYLNQASRKKLGISENDDLKNLSILDIVVGDKQDEITKLLHKSKSHDNVIAIQKLKTQKSAKAIPMELHFFYQEDNQKIGPLYFVVGKDLEVDYQLKLFRAVIENSQDFIGIADENLNPVYLNPAGRDMIGIPQELSLDQVKIKDCYPKAQEERVEKEIIPTMLKNGYWEGETYFKHLQTNEEIPVHDTHFLIRDSVSGEPLGSAMITRNLSELKKLQDRLNQERVLNTQNSKLTTIGEMAAGIAHEINNPLAIIDGSLVMLSKSKVVDDKMRDRLDKIKNASARVKRIVQGLRKFSRNNETLIKSVFSLKLLVDEAIELLMPKIKSSNVKVTNNVIEGIYLYADEVQVEQILVNLIKNAIEENESNNDPWVSIDAVEDGSYIHIKVRNSGKRIDKVMSEKIFDPFFTTKAVGVGTGLGLSVSKGIAQQHDGDLIYDLNDKDSCFVLTLPKETNESV